MALSIFTDKQKHPSDQDLVEALEVTYPIWKEIINHFYQHYQDISEQWNYSGKNYGWNLRIKSHNRNVIYLIPCPGYFKFAFVFGKKAVDRAMNSRISQQVKNEISNAGTYTEGTGFRVDVYDPAMLKDIKELIKIKLDK